MKRSLSIKLKALFLLIVFCLSTVMSFACAAGLDMGYNRGHHKAPATKHLSEGAVNHHHSKKLSQGHLPADTSKASNPHDEIDHHKKQESKSEESTPDDCCRDEAAKFEKSDKLSQQAASYNFQVFYITLFINPVFNADAVTVSLHHPNSRYLVRNHHPPIADTRIAIQSFLI